MIHSNGNTKCNNRDKGSEFTWTSREINDDPKHGDVAMNGMTCFSTVTGSIERNKRTCKEAAAFHETGSSSCILGCDIVQTCRCIRTFRKDMQPLSPLSP